LFRRSAQLALLHNIKPAGDHGNLFVVKLTIPPWLSAPQLTEIRAQHESRAGQV
jgi:hypothetical protein